MNSLFPDPPLPPHARDPIRPVARRTDPDTSHYAARSMVGEAAAQRLRVLDALRRRPAGMTCADVDLFIGWRETTASRRMPELLKLGLVIDSGLRRDTPSGRSAIVWRCA